jgi:hypothetical protein
VISRERLALRAGVVALLPAFIAALAGELELFPPVAGLQLPLEFLDAGPFPYPGKVIAFVLAIVVAIALLSRRWGPQAILGIALFGVVWPGYIYTTLQWSRLVNDWIPTQRGMPSPLAWLWGALALLVAVSYMMGEAMLDATEAQAKRGLDPAERAAFRRAAGEGVALALGGGVLLFGALAGALFLARSGLGAAWAAGLNPVYAFLVLGLALVVVVTVALRFHAKS